MIDELRIKCPSCGVVLEVTNSKHEEVKRITCPQCRKQLSVDFREEEPAAPPKPIEPLYYGAMPVQLHEGVNQIALPGLECVEVRVVRLKDGGSKVLVRPLDAKHTVKVNGQPLQTDDCVALAKGDVLEVGETTLAYGQAGSAQVTPTKPASVPPPSKPLSPYVWYFTATACVLALVVFLAWPTKKEKVAEPVVAEVVTETQSEQKDNEQKPEVRTVKKPEQKPDVPSNKPTKDYTPIGNLSNYDLEQKANGGNVEACLELSKRLATRKDANSVIRRIKYLQLANRGGSSEARTLLVDILNKLQQRAHDGDSAAIYVLMIIDQNS